MVMAIVAVLAAVLFPVFGQGRDAAKSADDLTNLKQLSQGASIYLLDADGVFAPVGSPASDLSWSPARDASVDASGNAWNGWGLRLAPYVKSYDVFRSPYFSKKGSYTGACAHATGMDLTNNYAMNWMLGSDGSFGSGSDKNDSFAWSPDGTHRFSRPMNNVEVMSPANTIAFMLSSTVAPSAQSWGCLYSTLQASDFDNQLQQYTLYNQGANLAFADGHASFFADERMNPASKGNPRAWTIFHFKSRGVWMEPTMPESSMGYTNLDPDGKSAGAL
ncbi:hypothetical protein OP10G_4009 [Fimbriimonas ginsengisoli Gsoil 348]|uniref:Uncharacterized protein n=1 Tax=Fimbriimonas ginsengisoli Gsoil 348 TaxID=661478 RepID=A0A068NVG8_FIMGI|nr:hypothetical protein OP10G_4009 [Fimbriimonas ginsengisoli Gsoil 348]